MTADTNQLTELLALLAAAAICVPLARRMRLGSVLGYLTAGAIIGPWGLGLISSVQDIQRPAEFGVAFLLFIVGIEMKLSRLWLMRRQVFGLGGAQVTLTAAILGSCAWALGTPAAMSVIAGLGLALSSTAMGLQTLSERGELATAYGRSGFAILLLQDLMVPVLFALVPILSIQNVALTASLGLAIVQGAAILAGVTLAGRFLLRPFLHIVARSHSAEVFTATILLIVLGIGWLTEHAGMSMAMGAFLAGLLLADSEFRHQIEADITPFRGLLLGLFFMGVGMAIDFGLLAQSWMQIAGLVLGLLTIKTVILVPLARLAGLSWSNAVRVGLLLSQGGEFAFVLLGFAQNQGAIASGLTDLLILVVSLSMATTPALAAAGHRLARMMEQTTSKSHYHTPVTIPSEEGSGHIILAGFGRVGRIVASLLDAAGQTYIAFDHNLDAVIQGRSKGYPVFFGDASRPEVMRAAHADKAALVILTMDDPLSTARALASIHHMYPRLSIHCRARDHEQSCDLTQAGATCAVPETLEASLQLGRASLTNLGLTGEHVERILEQFRSDNYAVLQRTLEERHSAKNL